ncbi:multidrug MFS transporter, partial [Candidatus Roizmanbacteria bacterium CG22_combo_CG10-13_8_21_14_all_33_16]
MNIFSGQNYLRFTKYLVDYLGAIILLLIFSPICFISVVAIKLNSPGPVFADVPERVGKDGKKFKMYKFRSMIVNAHQMLREDPKLKDLYSQYKKGSYKLKKDPRITSIGKILRKHSIDEIP